MQEIFNEISAEIEHQEDKWTRGTKHGSIVALDLEWNKPNDFVAYIARCSTSWHCGEFGEPSLEAIEDFRISMLKVAALAVSAMRYCDAKLEG